MFEGFGQPKDMRDKERGIKNWQRENRIEYIRHRSSSDENHRQKNAEKRSQLNQANGGY